MDDIDSFNSVLSLMIQNSGKEQSFPVFICNCGFIIQACICNNTGIIYVILNITLVPGPGPQVIPVTSAEKRRILLNFPQ